MVITGKEVHRDLLVEISRQSETLWERLDSVGDLPPEAETEKFLSDGLAAWSRVYAGGGQRALWRRLSWDGIDPRRAAAVLSVCPREVEPAEWTADLLLFADKAAVDLEQRGALNGGVGTRRPDLAFDELWLPWVEVAVERLSTIGRGAFDRLTAGARADLETLLLSEIARTSEAALYELFEARRMAAGDGESDFYHSFVAACLGDPVASIYQHFPVLARQTCLRVRQWCDMVAELLDRLERDREELAKWFDGRQGLGILTRIDSRLSDRHGGGRQVLLLEFDPGQRLVYKPRCVESEEFFASVVKWCRESGLALVPPAARVLSRTGYGWMEFARQESLLSREAARDYFRRAGALTALAYVLRARDLHAENIVATGAGPMLVDCEILLQPLRQKFTSGERSGDLATTPGSCLATGLLTLMLPNGEEDRELGGLRGSRRCFKEGRLWRQLNSDRMTMEEGRRWTEAGHNTVWIEGEFVDPEQFATELVEGFEAAYRFLLAHRSDFLAAASPLAGCLELQTRVLLRSSQEYGRVLYLTTFPRNQRSGVSGSWMHEAMLSMFVDWDDRPALWPLAREEREALEAGDIPTFWLRAGDSVLQTRGGEEVPGLFTSSGLEAVRWQLEGLSEEDLAHQLDLVRGALAPASASGQLASALRSDVAAPLDDVSTSCRALAQAAGEEVVAAAERGDYDSSDWTLADGRLGSALFLAALSSADVDPDNEARRDAALARLLDGVGRPSDPDWARAGDLSIGGLSGLGSVIWSLVWLARMRGDPALLAVAEEVATLFAADRVAADDIFDLTFGAAGGIMGLLALLEATDSQQVLEAATRCGDHLLSRQEVMSSSGAGWRNVGGLVQTGLAHGCAGIARALASLWAVTAETRFLAAASAALRYERDLFDRERGNWPVLLIDADGRRRKQWMTAYCRGAPGIALSRMLLPETLQTTGAIAERESALDTCVNAPLSHLDTLCCGTMGRSWILLTAAERTDSPERRAAAEKLARVSLVAAAKTGLFKTDLDCYENRQRQPGFLKGIAGIGFQLLRLTGVTDLPDVLALELEGERRERCSGK